VSLSDHLERLAGLARVWEPKTRYIPYANFVREPRTICYAHRWYGEKAIQFDAEWLDGGHEGMTRRVHALYDQADIVYTYNGIRFDNKHLQGDWLKLGLVKPRPWKDVDLYPVTSQFGYLSRSLDYTTRALGRPGKQLHYEHELAEAAVDGDEKGAAQDRQIQPRRRRADRMAGRQAAPVDQEPPVPAQPRRRASVPILRVGRSGIQGQDPCGRPRVRAVPVQAVQRLGARRMGSTRSQHARSLMTQDDVAAREASLKRDPTGRGLNHEGCDHAYGICTADWGDYD